ncbi:MAG: helicase-associated domain-containing protein [Oscillospiraceae bacterium]|nr:helicase-associated domain-containing protein [Oscillospiraceae bacterium]
MQNPSNLSNPPNPSNPSNQSNPPNLSNPSNPSNPPNPSNPLIVQSYMSVMLEVMNPLFERARDTLNAFAELQKSPEYMHTYKITPLSLWNAASIGITADPAPQKAPNGRSCIMRLETGP